MPDNRCNVIDKEYFACKIICNATDNYCNAHDLNYADTDWLYITTF